MLAVSCTNPPSISRIPFRRHTGPQNPLCQSSPSPSLLYPVSPSRTIHLSGEMHRAVRLFLPVSRAKADPLRLSGSSRSYTPLKVLGDGAFGTVWLCDWHGTLPPNTPLPLMQSPSRRPEWAGKRLVAVKRMKRKSEGTFEQCWNECQKNKELEVMLSSPLRRMFHIQGSSFPRLFNELSPCVTFHLTPTSLRSTIFSFPLIPWSYILYSSLWRVIYFSSSGREKASASWQAAL